MAILKLKPEGKEYLWGGTRLLSEFGKEFDGEILAETWELSVHPDGPSRIANGSYAGKTLTDYLDAKGKAAWGTNASHFEEFPILIKFIDAKQDLSVQVHPDNDYALKYEHQYGKTEMWYIVDCDDDATIYYGVKTAVTKEEFDRRIADNTLLEILNKVPVKPGDAFFIEAGTIHAIGAGALIAEIQQNSNVTYRVYDFGRMGPDGKPRELHVDKALEVSNFAPTDKRIAHPHNIATCEYFTVDKLNLDGRYVRRVTGVVTEESFLSVLVLDGSGLIENGMEELAYKKGDSFFLPAGSGTYELTGMGEFLLTYIDDKETFI
ncbi:MAG: class I mannose-6-phosphate isomerase [Clostridiales Family XIII bacterium]|nr:class I mannose-6-phosphate isomerase [Clostridiales Family XIII bacterium]